MAVLMAAVHSSISQAYLKSRRRRTKRGVKNLMSMFKTLCNLMIRSLLKIFIIKSMRPKGTLLIRIKT
jgi:hypothetical protein